MHLILGRGEAAVVLPGGKKKHLRGTALERQESNWGREFAEVVIVDNVAYVLVILLVVEFISFLKINK